MSLWHFCLLWSKVNVKGYVVSSNYKEELLNLNRVYFLFIFEKFHRIQRREALG